MKQILALILVNVLFTIVFSQPMDKTTRNIEPDSLNGTDSTATLEKAQKSKTDSTSFDFFIRFWDQKNILQMNSSLSFTYRNPEFSIQWGKLPSGSEILRQYGNSNFQGSTAYQLSYADELYKTYVLKPDYGNGMVVPILPMAFLALYGAREGFLALQKDPLISLEATDVKILEIIWDNPDLTDVDYYQIYNQHDFATELTYLTMRKRLDKLEKQKLLISRFDGESNIHYNSNYTRQELMQRLEEELNKNEDPQHRARNLEIQRMKMLLVTGAEE